LRVGFPYLDAVLQIRQYGFYSCLQKHFGITLSVPDYESGPVIGALKACALISRSFQKPLLIRHGVIQSAFG
jgi:hypothetical protein